MEAITDPSTPAFLSGGGGFLSSPPPVLVPGKGRLIQLRLRRLLALEDRSSHSSALSLRWSSCRLLGSWWMFGSWWMRFR
ncbi:hypothetical protein Bca4012_066226 [Brassica carinata]